MWIPISGMRKMYRNIHRQHFFFNDMAFSPNYNLLLCIFLRVASLRWAPSTLDHSLIHQLQTLYYWLLMWLGINFAIYSNPHALYIHAHEIPLITPYLTGTHLRYSLHQNKVDLHGLPCFLTHRLMPTDPIFRVFPGLHNKACCAVGIHQIC